MAVADTEVLLFLTFSDQNKIWKNNREVGQRPTTRRWFFLDYCIRTQETKKVCSWAYLLKNSEVRQFVKFMISIKLRTHVRYLSRPVILIFSISSSVNRILSSKHFSYNLYQIFPHFFYLSEHYLCENSWMRVSQIKMWNEVGNIL